jgi:hypothetical protein
MDGRLPDEDPVACDEIVFAEGRPAIRTDILDFCARVLAIQFGQRRSTEDGQGA